jgi:hypothetical protein
MINVELFVSIKHGLFFRKFVHYRLLIAYFDLLFVLNNGAFFVAK